MTSPESFRKLKRRARGLLKAYLKHPMSDPELLDRLIDLRVDERCERLEELCPEPSALDQASVRPLLKRLTAEVRAEGLPARTLDVLAVPESGKHSLVVDMSKPRHAMQATHPSLKRAMLAHGLERALPFEFRGRLRTQAAEELYYRRLDPALRDKLEELVLVFPLRLSTPPEPVSPPNLSGHTSQSVSHTNAKSSEVVINVVIEQTSIEGLSEDICDPITVAGPAIEPQPAISADLAAEVAAQSAEGSSLIPAVREKAADPIMLPTDAEIEAFINAARTSRDPGLAFWRLLKATDWTRRAWAEDAGSSEPTVSRWIRKMPVRRSEERLWSALRRRLREHWQGARGITFENL